VARCGPKSRNLGLTDEECNAHDRQLPAGDRFGALQATVRARYRAIKQP
jgi:hypothetical protein